MDTGSVKLEQIKSITMITSSEFLPIITSSELYLSPEITFKELSSIIILSKHLVRITSSYLFPRITSSEPLCRIVSSEPLPRITL